MTEIECIYCKQTKPKSDYSKKEHVIPQSFGMFTNNFDTLIGMFVIIADQYVWG